MQDEDFRVITPAYLATMGIPVVSGRNFAAGHERTPNAILISRSMASKYWPGVSAIGEQIRLGDVVDGPVFTVVGVVGDVRYYNLEQPEIRPMMYFPLSQNPTARLTIVVRTSATAESVAPALRAVVRELDRALPVPDVQQMSTVLRDVKAQRRFNAWVFASFGGIACCCH